MTPYSLLLGKLFLFLLKLLLLSSKFLHLCLQLLRFTDILGRKKGGGSEEGERNDGKGWGGREKRGRRRKRKKARGTTIWRGRRKWWGEEGKRRKKRGGGRRREEEENSKRTKTQLLWLLELSYEFLSLPSFTQLKQQLLICTRKQWEKAIHELDPYTIKRRNKRGGGGKKRRVERKKRDGGVSKTMPHQHRASLTFLVTSTFFSLS